MTYIKANHSVSLGSISGTNQTASGNVLVGPIDVRKLDFYSILLQNAHSAVSVVKVQLQETCDDSAIAPFTALGSSACCTVWRTVDSDTFRCFDSAIVESGSHHTSAIRNNAAFIRIIGGISTSDTTLKLRCVVSGRV